MSRSGKITLEFADGEYDFRLPIGQLVELQEKTGRGPAKLFEDLRSGTWLARDPSETIRLGLIGGGLKPNEAVKLVRSYVEERPLTESVFTAMAILAAALFGAGDEERVGKPEEPEAAPNPQTEKSPSHKSMEPEQS